MCGRFVVASSPQLLVDRFGVEEDAVGEREPDYNVTPRAVVPVVRERPPRRSGAGADAATRATTTRVLSPLRWGLVPSWAESPAIGDRMINARAETIATTNSYKTAFRKRRCIVPADAFYEWQQDRAVAVDRRSRCASRGSCSRRDGEPLAFAGLWEIWRDEAIERPRRAGRVAAHVRDRDDAGQRPARARAPAHAGGARRTTVGPVARSRRSTTSRRCRRSSSPRPTSGSTPTR